MNDRNDSEKSRQVKQRNKALFTIPDLVHCWKRGNDMKNRAIIVLLAAVLCGRDGGGQKFCRRGRIRREYAA